MHKIKQHGRGGLQKNPLNYVRAFGHPPYTDNALHKLYTDNLNYILAPHNKGRVTNQFNFPSDDLHKGNQELIDAFQYIQNDIGREHKFNVALGYIIRNPTTDKYRYFAAHLNNALFEMPLLVTDNLTEQEMENRLREIDIMQSISNFRPNSNWELVLITNIVFFVTQTGFVFGKVPSLFPKRFLHSRGLVSLIKTKHGRYTDNLCIFRCLALHRLKYKKPQKFPRILALVKRLYKQWVGFLASQDIKIPSCSKKYSGIKLPHIPLFEQCFQVSIFVYTLAEDKSAQLVFKSLNKRGAVLRLNVYSDHFSYICDFAKYARKFTCTNCYKSFPIHSRLTRHTKLCRDKSVLQFPGGFFSPSKTVFEQLEQCNISVPVSERYFDYFTVFDFESMLYKIKYQNTPKLSWETKHVPISVSVCSNIPDHTTPCFMIDTDLDKLLGKLFSKLKEMQQAMKVLTRLKWNAPMQQLKDKLEASRELYESFEEKLSHIKEPPPEKIFQMRILKQNFKQLSSLHARFTRYIDQMLVIGFNSQNYDLLLIREKLFKFLAVIDECDNEELEHEQMGENIRITSPPQSDQEENSETMVDFRKITAIKRNNSYLALSNNRFKFLDILNYLSPGFSYAQFLSAFHSNEKKGYFCYEYLDSPEKLLETELPPHEAFYSELKQSNITAEQYEEVKTTWAEKGFENLGKYLEYYNNLDVKPFVGAICTMQKFYFDKGIDLFKDSLSVPGVARKMLFRDALRQNVHFQIPGVRDKDLYYTLRANLVGGPSIIFHRKAIAGETCIRNSANLVRSCEGMDANSLYLFCIGQKMPVGAYVRRFETEGFIPHKELRYTMMYEYLNWKSAKRGIPILHKLNSKEHRVDNFYCDGYTPTLQLIHEVSIRH